MDEAAINAILQMNPKRIVYVSCECETLARDAKQLAQGGYTLQHVHAFDMFPRTGHVETVAMLERN
jgi:23S rRNA (uracil1939-C5)-methyltransferase